MGSQVAAYPNGARVAEMFAGLFAEDEIEATRARAKGEVLLRLLERRGISVDDTTREIVLTMPERPTWRHLIDVWIDRVATANSMEEVFRDSDVDRT